MPHNLAQSRGTHHTASDITNVPAGNISSTNVQNAINELDTEKVNYTDLPANIILYPTNVSSDIGGYYKMVSSIDDPSYNSTAVDIPTGDITTTAQFIASLASSAGVLKGNPGIVNINTIGNIRRVSGTGVANFFYRVYKRNSAGTETLLCTSLETTDVSSATYEQFSAVALLNDGTFLETDRIVIKYYGNRVAGGSDPAYQFQFGGSTPVRTTLPVPITTVYNIEEIKTLSIAFAIAL